MPAQFSIRPAKLTDAMALREIYRPYVETTAVSFEVRMPSVEGFSQRIESALASWSWLVAEREGKTLGYAYGSAHRPREAYRYSVETSAYIKERYQRHGIARALYTHLFTELDRQGLKNAYAGITLPNEASVGFHSSLGFKPIGVFPRVGRKFDRWHDVAWMHRALNVEP